MKVRIKLGGSMLGVTYVTLSRKKMAKPLEGIGKSKSYRQPPLYTCVCVCVCECVGDLFKHPII